MENGDASLTTRPRTVAGIWRTVAWVQIVLSVIGIGAFAVLAGMAFYTRRAESIAALAFGFYAFCCLPAFFTLISGVGLLRGRRWVKWLNLAILSAVAAIVLAVIHKRWGAYFLLAVAALLVLLMIGKWLLRPAQVREGQRVAASIRSTRNAASGFVTSIWRAFTHEAASVRNLAFAVGAYLLGLAGYALALLLVGRRGFADPAFVLFATATTYVFVALPLYLMAAVVLDAMRGTDPAAMPWTYPLVPAILGIVPAGLALGIGLRTLHWLLVLPESVPFLALFCVAGLAFGAGWARMNSAGTMRDWRAAVLRSIAGMGVALAILSAISYYGVRSGEKPADGSRNAFSAGFVHSEQEARYLQAHFARHGFVLQRQPLPGSAADVDYHGGRLVEFMGERPAHPNCSAPVRFRIYPLGFELDRQGAVFSLPNVTNGNVVMFRPQGAAACSGDPVRFDAEFVVPLITTFQAMNTGAW